MMPRLNKLAFIFTIGATILSNFSLLGPQAQILDYPEGDTISEGLLTIEENSLLPHAPLPEPKVARKLNVIVTAYSSTVSQTDDDPFITAANTFVRDGIVANNLLPFGTKIRMPELYGEKIFVVEDRMNRRKSNYHVDIWFPLYWEAKSFGAKLTYIEILAN